MESDGWKVWAVRAERGLCTSESLRGKKKKHQLIRSNVRSEKPVWKYYIYSRHARKSRAEPSPSRKLSMLCLFIDYYYISFFLFTACAVFITVHWRLICGERRLGCTALALGRRPHPAHISSCALSAASCNIQQRCKREESGQGSEYDPALV